jgi:hypothetical protein
MNRSVAIVVLIALLQVGCSQMKQDAQSTLYETRVSSDVSEFPNAKYVGQVSVGPEGKTVPVRVTWSAGQDKEGCLRIVNLKVERTGGDPSVVIDDVKHVVLPDCAMRFDSPDTRRFQSAIINLHYETRNGLKAVSFNGRIASIQGNGEFIP